MQRIRFERTHVGRRRGLEEVTVTLGIGDREVSGQARAGRRRPLAVAAAEATFAALGERVPAPRDLRVGEMEAGPVRIVRVSFSDGSGAYEGSCSRTNRTLEEAVARCVLDALNPWWEANADA